MHLFKVLAEGSSQGQDLATGLEIIHFIYFRRSNQSTDDMACLKKKKKTVNDEKQNSQRSMYLFSNSKHMSVESVSLVKSGDLGHHYKTKQLRLALFIANN